MRTARTGESADTAHDSRSDLVEPLRHLEGARWRAQDELARLGGAALPGLHLVVEAAGRRGLLAASRVQEIVRLVAFDPRPGAPPAQLGTFVWRGVPVVAVDLAALLGVRRAPALDAQIAVLAGTPVVGLVLDRIHGLHERPVIHLGGQAPAAWEAARLVHGLCTVGGEVLPLLDPGPVIASVGEEVA
jgi:purine-binding chemotaxis protein CheW